MEEGTSGDPPPPVKKMETVPQTTENNQNEPVFDLDIDFLDVLSDQEHKELAVILDQAEKLTENAVVPAPQQAPALRPVFALMTNNTFN